jgi:hypothetical protein
LLDNYGLVAFNDGNATEASSKKPSLYQKYQEKKQGPGISDADLLKYTGKTREELNAWADTQPGVGKNQLAGKLSAGPTSGLAGMSAAEGLGGWGHSTEPGDAKNRGMKFPPGEPAAAKRLEDED